MTQGPLVPLQQYIPTPTVLSTSVTFLMCEVLFFPYCSEEFYTFNNILTCQFSCLLDSFFAKHNAWKYTV